MTTTKTPNRAADLMEEIATKIIDSIVAGIPSGKWTKPWNSKSMATNAVTRKQYTGGNLLWLWILEETEGYKQGLWATYKQWESIEAQVRKGEHGIKLVKWVGKVCQTHRPDETCHQCGRMFPSVFTVFNADQVDGFDVDATVGPVLTEDQRIAAAETFFAQQGSTVHHKDGASAYYKPSTDEITMPLFEVFHSAEAYYGTLGHEHIHWTGAKARLDRDLSTKFGDDAYAMEELVAELGAAMLSGHLGITDTPRNDHAQYLSHWARILGADSKALWTAASKASAAVQFLISNTTTKED